MARSYSTRNASQSLSLVSSAECTSTPTEPTTSKPIVVPSMRALYTSCCALTPRYWSSGLSDLGGHHPIVRSTQRPALLGIHHGDVTDLSQEPLAKVRPAVPILRVDSGGLGRVQDGTQSTDL